MTGIIGAFLIQKQ